MTKPTSPESSTPFTKAEAIEHYMLEQYKQHKRVRFTSAELIKEMSTIEGMAFAVKSPATVPNVIAQMKAKGILTPLGNAPRPEGYQGRTLQYFALTEVIDKETAPKTVTQGITSHGNVTTERRPAMSNPEAAKPRHGTPEHTIEQYAKTINRLESLLEKAINALEKANREGIDRQVAANREMSDFRKKLNESVETDTAHVNHILNLFKDSLHKYDQKWDMLMDAFKGTLGTIAAHSGGYEDAVKKVYGGLQVLVEANKNRDMNFSDGYKRGYKDGANAFKRVEEAEEMAVEDDSLSLIKNAISELLGVKVQAILDGDNASFTFDPPLNVK